MGAERSWSAAWCQWPNGRAEAYALVPGIPGLAERERQDALPRGVYQRLADLGVLLVDENRRMARAALLVDHLDGMGIEAEMMICDRFLIGALTDAVAGRWPVVPRRTRWSESTEDIAAFRGLALDGGMAPAPASVQLIAMSLAGAEVRSDESGGARIVKARAARSRDDVAVAGVLAAGQIVRAGIQPQGFFFHVPNSGQRRAG